MKTTTSKPQPAAEPGAQQAARARFLEVRAGRLRPEEPRTDYSSRLAPDRRFSGEPTD